MDLTFDHPKELRKKRIRCGRIGSCHQDIDVPGFLLLCGNAFFQIPGRSRWLGRRPRNRGVVMNPVDHPMGGGEGRASGGHPRSRKGLFATGLKTRAPKKHSSKYIIERRKK